MTKPSSNTLFQQFLARGLYAIILCVLIGCQGARSPSPEPFELNTLLDITPGTWVTSNAITLTGLSTSITVTVIGGAIICDVTANPAAHCEYYDIQNQKSELVLPPNSQFKVATTAPALPSSEKLITVRAGSFETTWIIRTAKGQPPLAVISGDSVISLTTEQTESNVILSAELSTDPNQDIVEYRWLNGEGATLGNNLTLLQSLSAGRHHYRLQITDSEGHQDQAETTITVLPSAEQWLTSGDQTHKLSAISDAPWQPTSSGEPDSNLTINIDAAQQFQSMEGLGFALTQGSAMALLQLPKIERQALLEELFSTELGLGISMLRITVGASDLSTSLYSYNSVANDTAMQHFSLDGPDNNSTFVILAEILAINPTIKLLASPWSAPPWMKTNNNWVGGRLKPVYYTAYARYLVRYFDEMKKLGFNFWGLTPQNEPLHAGNEPSMAMSADEQLDFINNHLGPALEQSSHAIKILAYDHNCDHPEYPIAVANGSRYVAGPAFHLYGGDISALTHVKNATRKDVYFTEQWTGANGDFDGDLGWHMEHVVIGATRNWARTVLEWNLASTPPNLARGCLDCQGAISIDEANQTITRHVSYYIIGQLSRFLPEGSTRIASSDDNGGIFNVAFSTPSGERVLLIYNSTDSQQNISVRSEQIADAHLPITVAPRSALTLKWQSFRLD